MINFELAQKAIELVTEVFGKYNKRVQEKLANIKFAVATATSHFDRNNTVYISPKALNDLSVYVHELLHVVSTSISFNKHYIGFHKRYDRQIGEDLLIETNIGYALNEGATECLTRDVIEGKYQKAQCDTCYNFCSNVYKNLEKVLTSSLAKVLYANANVDNFIKAIATNAHTNQDNVIKLILNLDAYYDTYRIYNVFLLNPNSADVLQLLTNTYTYLAAIMSDYAKSQGKEFNFWTDICKDYLTKEELLIFADVANNVDLNNAKSNPLATLKTYDRMAMYLFTMQTQNKLDNFDILPDYLKCGEFYNLLLLSTQLCDKNGISFDIRTKDEVAKLTQKIYSPKYRALHLNSNLPQDIKTMLSARYAIRAGTLTSDFYMEQCMKDKSFREFMMSSDPDYFEALCEMVKSKQQPTDQIEEKPQNDNNTDYER